MVSKNSTRTQRRRQDPRPGAWRDGVKLTGFQTKDLINDNPNS